MVSYGTEGRSEEEVPASDNVYEYIVFRGSDVKDLRIEKEPEKKREEVKVPDDPAILGVRLLFHFPCMRVREKSLCDHAYSHDQNELHMMKNCGCKTSVFVPPRAQNRVDISVAFLLSPSQHRIEHHKIFYCDPSRC